MGKSKNKYEIEYNGTVIAVISAVFLEHCNATNNLELIKDAFKHKHELILEMLKIPTQDRLIELAEEIHCIDYIIQDLYGFPMDFNYHRFWEVPQCSCPLLDNQDRWGTGSYIMAKDCKIHGC